MTPRVINFDTLPRFSNPAGDERLKWGSEAATKRERRTFSTPRDL
jgi:hypothetical protein